MGKVAFGARSVRLEGTRAEVEHQGERIQGRSGHFRPSLSFMALSFMALSFMALSFMA
jgi:hypothetical protein